MATDIFWRGALQGCLALVLSDQIRAIIVIDSELTTSNPHVSRHELTAIIRPI